MFVNGKGLFGVNPMQPQMNTQQMKPREGPSRTQSILGILGDMLASASGGQPAYTQNLMQQRQLQQLQGYRTQQNKMQQDAEQQTWLARQAYERANPAPPEPTAMQRNYEWLQSTNPGVAQDYLAAQSRDPNDETVSVTIPNVGTYVGPRSGMAQAFGGQRGGDRPAIGSTIRLDGAQRSAANGPPTPTTTPEGLGAMISVHGSDQVERWMQSGQLTVRSN